MAAFGTWAWAERTGGRLTRRDRARLAISSVVRTAAGRLRSKRNSKELRVDLETVRVPDTAICRAADALCAEVSPAFLYQHCRRAYLWARLLSGSEDCDLEALHVSLMLHDLGLTERYRPAVSDECFTLAGARLAHGLARQHGWPDRRAHALADAICLHVNATVSARHGRVAHWVQAGAIADVVGLGLGRLPRDQRMAVLARHPRLGMKIAVSEALSCEAERCPCGRIAYLESKLGLTQRIRATPVFTD